MALSVQNMPVEGKFLKTALQFAKTNPAVFPQRTAQWVFEWSAQFSPVAMPSCAKRHAKGGGGREGRLHKFYV